MKPQHIQALIDAAYKVAQAGRDRHGWMLHMTPEQQALVDAIKEMRRGTPVYCGLRRPVTKA